MSRIPRHFAVMPAAGTGSRLGGALPKQYLDLHGVPMLARTARALLDAPWIERLVVVVAPRDRRAAPLLAQLPRAVVVPEGGATRRDSVLAGLAILRRDFATHDDDWVLVHDAARPGLDRAALERLREALHDDAVGGLLALPVDDTVKRARSVLTPSAAVAETLLAVVDTVLPAHRVAQAIDGTSQASARASHPEVGETLDRKDLWLAQTPQMFRFGLLLDALVRFPDVTDESAAVERAGVAPRLVPGSRGNFKVTTAADLEAMREALAAKPAAGDPPNGPGARLRIGQGYDVHALVPGRPLVIGGVPIEHSHGLLGHSDADVLLHAITDALLGAAGQGDIGRHFPDTDPRFAGADSSCLLREANARVLAAGYRVVNVDATVIAQSPRLAPHIAAMNAGIAAALALAPERVNVKAKTSERLGFVGRSEGIVAEAIVLLERQVGLEAEQHDSFSQEEAR